MAEIESFLHAFLLEQPQLAAIVLENRREMSQARPVFNNDTANYARNSWKKPGNARQAGNVQGQCFDEKMSASSQKARNPQFSSVPQEYSTQFTHFKIDLKDGDGDLSNLLDCAPDANIVDIEALSRRAVNAMSNPSPSPGPGLGTQQQQQQQQQFVPKQPKPVVAEQSGKFNGYAQNTQNTQNTAPSNSGPAPSKAQMTQQSQFVPQVHVEIQSAPLQLKKQNKVDSQPKTAATATATAHTPFKQLRWQYIDPNNNIQGPFQQDKMHMWYSQGHFRQELMIKETDRDEHFTTLQERWRNAPSGPFTCDPDL